MSSEPLLRPQYLCSPASQQTERMGSTAITRYQEGRGYDFLLPFHRMGYGTGFRLFLWIKCELPRLGWGL